MKSIKRRFDKISKNNPLWSSFICFAETIKNKNFSKRTIHEWFNKLVEKEDYDKKEKRAILSYLENL